jgi:hypothetical protein
MDAVPPRWRVLPCRPQKPARKKKSLCYNAAIMKFNIRFANNNNDNDDLTYRWAKLC